MESEAKPVIKTLPSLDEICLDFNLYFEVDMSPIIQRADFRAITQGEGQKLDAYCIECKQNATFRSHTIYVVYEDGEEEADITVSEFRCTRNELHKMYFVFHQGKDSIIRKIGQYPASAELRLPEIRDYRKVLGSEKYSEFVRAIGLSSYDVGIGAFIYLRRIFEFLIQEAYKEAKSDSTWAEEDYQAARMDEKVRLLAAYLPEFLVEQSYIYSILSKGIHELTEQECLQMFPVLQVGIELILDEKLEKQRKAEKTAQAKAALNATQQALKAQSK
jgi:hypothetical protein